MLKNKLKTRRTIIAAALALTLPLAGQTRASDTPAAPPAQAYAIDETRYFSSPDAEHADLDLCRQEAQRLIATKPAGGQALGQYMEAASKLMGRLTRHSRYFKLLSARNIEDHAAAEARHDVGAIGEQLMHAVDGTLHALGQAAFDRAAAEAPELARYAYYHQTVARTIPHELSPAEQTVLDTVLQPANDALWNIYQQTARTTPSIKIDTAAGPLDSRKDADALARDADRKVRQAWWQNRWQQIGARTDLYAANLLGVVRLNDKQAKLHKFPDAVSATYFNNSLDRERVDAALGQFREHTAIYKRYQQLRAGHIAKLAGIPDVHSWDLDYVSPGKTVPQLTLDQSRTICLQALAPLGKDYVRHFRELLDPANGRMDIAAAGGKRVDDGFSLDAPGVPSGLFVQSYGHGYVENTRVIIHEGGHAIHGQLMNEAGTSTLYQEGPSWLLEAYATLNEFLMYDYLAAEAKDPATRAYYLEAGLDNMGFQLFGSAEEATLEEKIYDGTAAGKINNAADLDTLALGIWQDYEIWPAIDPELKHIWATKRLMYQDPLYLVNYLYSGLVAANMLDMLQRDPKGFERKYNKLLSEGFDADPQVLLDHFFGARIGQQQMVERAADIFASRVAELERTYGAMEQAAREGRTGH